jgi:hypothetical protein
MIGSYHGSGLDRGRTAFKALAVVQVLRRQLSEGRPSFARRGGSEYLDRKALSMLFDCGHNFSRKG